MNSILDKIAKNLGKITLNIVRGTARGRDLSEILY